MLRDWLELIRVPNVFTAMADVVMGFFFVTPVAAFDAQAAVTLAMLVAASSLLYSAGMVLNDVCDYEEDCRERPGRPLPSGRISRRAAARAGVGLIVASLLAAAATMGFRGGGPLVVASALAACVVVYDRFLTRIVVGPIVLGVCRMLNVMLGRSAAPWDGWAGRVEPRAECLFVSAVIGFYVVGVSVMARGETGWSPRASVLRGVVPMLVAVGLLAGLPDWRLTVVGTAQWRWIVTVLAILVAWRCSRALVDPSPRVVQQAVGQSLRSRVVLDAMITLAGAGIVPGVAVLALLVPNILLSRWFYST